MTSQLVRGPLLQVRRQLAAQAAAAPRQPAASASSTSMVEPDPQVTTLESGLTLVSVPSQSPVATLGLVVKSGSRHETYDNLGVSHAMRVACGLAGRNYSYFGITRNLQQAGANLVCTQGREHTVYGTHVLREQVDDIIDYFLDAVTNPAFKPWEVSDNANRINVELQQLDPTVVATELLHKAAYRDGLGNSVYTPQFMAAKHKPAMLRAFFNQTCTTHRAALVGIGIEQSTLAKYAGSFLKLESGQGPSDKAKYYGGEQRQDATGKKAYVCIAGEAPGYQTSIEQAVAAMLVQRVLGVGVGVKWGSGAGKLQQALGPDVNAQVSGINHVYSDSGLLGASIVANASEAGKVVEKVAATLRTANVTAKELEAAKKSLLAEAYSMMEKPMSKAEDYGMQAVFDKQVTPLSKYPEIINAAKIGDVQAVAKKLASGKLSMSAVGNLGNVPYLDSL